VTEATPIAGLLLGLAGSTHCIAMCGGVASALDRAAPGERRHRIGPHVLYAVGRLTSYALFGALAGSLGFVLGEAFGPELAPQIKRGARLGVGVLLIALGIGLAGFRPLARVERLGISIWRRLQPLSQPVMRLPGPTRALALGALWGFLPCGMVYGASAVAAVTGSAGQGALFMTAFGLGTVPAVLGMGAFAAELWARLGRRNLRRVAAFAVVLCGVWTLVGPTLLATVPATHPATAQQAGAHAHH
jgi:sulfite exporter TauE/SafE